MRGISWLAAKPVSFSRRTLLHGVSKCVCILAVVTRRAKRMRHVVTCDLPSSTLFSHIQYRARLSEKKLLNIQCVLWFSLQMSSQTFLILRRIQGGSILSALGLHVKYPLFYSTWNFSTDCREILKCQTWNSVQWEPRCSTRTDRQPWRSE
jgi:hypothetical protein